MPADAVSKVPNTMELLQITCSTVTSDLYARIQQGWVMDSELQAIIAKLQGDTTSAKHYS